VCGCAKVDVENTVPLWRECEGCWTLDVLPCYRGEHELTKPRSSHMPAPDSPVELRNLRTIQVSSLSTLTSLAVPVAL
jgi:hypothetical protein